MLIRWLFGLVAALWFGLLGGCFPDVEMVRRMEQRGIDRDALQTGTLQADHKAIAQVVAPAAVPTIDANAEAYAAGLAANRKEADDDQGMYGWILSALMATGGLGTYASRKMSGSGGRINDANRRAERAEDKFDALKDELLRRMPPPADGG